MASGDILGNSYISEYERFVENFRTFQLGEIVEYVQYWSELAAKQKGGLPPMAVIRDNMQEILLQMGIDVAKNLTDENLRYCLTQGVVLDELDGREDFNDDEIATRSNAITLRINALLKGDSRWIQHRAIDELAIQALTSIVDAQREQERGEPFEGPGMVLVREAYAMAVKELGGTITTLAVSVGAAMKSEISDHDMNQLTAAVMYKIKRYLWPALEKRERLRI